MGKIIMKSISQQYVEITLLFWSFHAWLDQQVCSSNDGKPLGKGLVEGSALQVFVTLFVNPIHMVEHGPC